MVDAHDGDTRTKRGYNKDDNEGGTGVKKTSKAAGRRWYRERSAQTREGADDWRQLGGDLVLQTVGSQQLLLLFQLESFFHPRQGWPDGSVPIGCWRGGEESKAWVADCHGADPDSLGRDMHLRWRVEHPNCQSANHLQLVNARTLHRIKPSKPQRLIGVHCPHSRD